MTAGPTSGEPLHDWPAPHPVIDAPYGPRYVPPPEVDSGPAPWVREPLAPVPRSTTWTVVFVVVTLTVAVLGGLLAFNFVTKEHRPAQWDPRVAPLAAFVERQTGYTFRRPVPVRFLTDAEFEKLVTAGPPDATQQEQYRRDEAVGRAFGWYDGSTDLYRDTNQMNASGILAYYSFDRQEIVARSQDPAATALPVDLKVTIVHELVHGIQDQELDVSRYQPRYPGTDGDAALSALIEGHAVSVEQAYLAQLSPAEYQQYVDANRAVAAEINTRASGVPRALSVPLAMPYVFGPVLVDAAANTDDGIAQLYRTPPAAVDQVVDPLDYFSGDLPEPTEKPEVPGTPLDPGTVGVVRLYLTLASAIDPEDAWDAALTWGNDVYVPYRTAADQVCVAWSIWTDTAEGAVRLQAALGTWAASRPVDAQVSVGASTRPLTVTVCDPGASTTQALVGLDAERAFYIRAFVLDELLGRKIALSRATCATDAFMRATDYAEVADDRIGATLEPQVDTLLAGCP